VFGYVGREIRERRENLPENYPFFFKGKMRGLGVFMDLGTPFEAHGAQDRASGLIRCNESTS